MTTRVVGLSYLPTGSANLWPLAIVLCDVFGDLPAVGLVTGMRAYVIATATYYVTDAVPAWVVDTAPVMVFPTPGEISWSRHFMHMGA